MLAGVTLLLVWYLTTLNAISAPSEGIISKIGSVTVALNLPSNQQSLDPIRLPFSPQSIMPAMTQAKDAAPAYRQALDKFKADKFTYSDLFETGKPKTTDLKDLPALQFLIDARNCKTMDLFGANPREVIEYGRPAAEPLEGLYHLGKAASKLALYIKKEQPDQALLLGEATFSLGVKMCEERLRWREFEIGADLLRDGAYIIKSVDPARAQTADINEPMRLLLKDRCMPLWTVIGSADPAVISRTSGDMFFISKNAKERMWRIEAILKLGRNKFDIGETGRGADQRWATTLVKKMSNDTTLPPAIHTAAAAANELTRDRWLTLGG